MIEFQIELSDEPGELAGVAEAIATGGANILGAAAIGKAKPTVALVVDDENATKASLEELGASYVMNELLLYSLEHRPGALAEFTRKIADSGVNLNSFYIMHIEETTAEIAFTVDNPTLICEMFDISN